MDPTSHDDIDLQELAVRVIRYFKRHLIFILVSCSLGIALGVVAFTALPRIYESRMVVLSDLLTKTYGDRIDQALGNLIREDNYAELSSKLQLPQEKVSSITSIDVECITDVKAPQRKDLQKDETYFIVTINLIDRAALPDIQEGLLRYFRSNELVKVRTRQREELNTAVVNQIDKELQSIDSLKKVLFQAKFKTGELMFDPASLFEASVELTRLRWESQQDLELANSIHLVEGFTAFQKPRDPKLLTLGALGFLLGLLGSIGILTLKHLFNLARS